MSNEIDFRANRIRRSIIFGKPETIQDAIEMGMIPKSKLKDNHAYRGSCRNASIAWWVEADQKFHYWRQKFHDRFIDTINHPEDDDGFDLFIPIVDLGDKDD